MSEGQGLAYLDALRFAAPVATWLNLYLDGDVVVRSRFTLWAVR